LHRRSRLWTWQIKLRTCFLSCRIHPILPGSTTSVATGLTYARMMRWVAANPSNLHPCSWMSRRPDRMKHQMHYRYYPACSPSFYVSFLFLFLFFALYVQPVHRSRRCCAPSPFFFSFFAASDHFLSLSNWLGCLHSFELPSSSSSVS
jgi:hypothetical protein